MERKSEEISSVQRKGYYIQKSEEKASPVVNKQYINKTKKKTIKKKRGNLLERQR